MQQNGLALATCIAWLSGAVFLTLDLAYKARLSLGRMTREVLGILAALVVCLVSYAVLDTLWSGESYGTVAAITRLAIIVTVGMTAYLFVAFLVKLPEPEKLWRVVKSKLQ